MKKKYIDLSHSIKDGMITYKGLPAPIICDYLSRQDSEAHYEAGTSFQIGKIEMVTNTGTYLDCPFHRYAEGDDLAALCLTQLTDLAGVLIDVSTQPGLAIDVDCFVGKALSQKAVLVYTGWSAHWGTDTYFEDHPYLTETAAMYLQEQGAALVGIDAHNIDDTRGRTRPVHSVLLGQDILIVEHLTNLKQLKGKRFTFSAVPPKIAGAGTFPVRAFAKIN